MNRPMLMNFAKQTLAWTVMVALSGAVAIAQSPAPAAGERTDGQIEMDVVHALDGSKALKKDMITAATIQSEVTLSGTVASEASSELAESIAAHVAGVSRVHNNLQVGSPAAAQNAGTDPNAQQMAADAQPEVNAAPAPGPNDGPMAVPDQGQMQPQNQQQPAPQPAPAVRPQYRPLPPPSQAYEAPRGPVSVPQGTLLQVRTSEPVNSKFAKDGTPVQFTVIHDVVAGGVLAIPRGATVHGVVTEVKREKAGELGGRSELALKLTSLDLGGQSYDLDSDQFKVVGPSKAGQTVGSALTGGLIGTIIGCAVGRGTGCAVGAGAGVAAGTAASAASSGPNVWIPAEALVDFHLAAPLTVTPVSAQEAARLAQGLNPGGPTLYRRAGYATYGAYGYPVAYPYPPVYYRPYYVVGGAYYWR